MSLHSDEQPAADARPPARLKAVGAVAARPLVPAAIGLMIGICLVFILPPRPTAWLFCAAICTVAAVLLRWRFKAVDEASPQQFDGNAEPTAVGQASVEQISVEGPVMASTDTSEGAGETKLKSPEAAQPVSPTLIEVDGKVIAYNKPPPRRRSTARLPDAAISFAVFAAFVFVGLTAAQVWNGRFPDRHIARFSQEQRHLAELQLRIIDPPRIFAPNFGQRYPLPPKQTTLASVTAVRTWSGWQKAKGQVLVQIAEPHPGLAAGQDVRAFGYLDRPAPAMNPGQFDWATYYRRQRVLCSFSILHAGNIAITESHPPTWLTRWRSWTRDKLADGFTTAQSLDYALLRALVLGDSDPELRDVQEQFHATGTSHHLAISGMHVAVMGGAVFFICRLLRLPPRRSWLAAMIFVLCYGLAALPSPPVVRAVLLWTAVGIAMLNRRAIDLVNLLALVVIIMLLFQPLDLLNAGFQLSFGTVLGLIILTGPIARLFGMAADPATHDPKQSRLMRLTGHLDRQILLIIAAGVTAWLVAMPVVSMHFTQLNVWGVLSSIVMAPVVFTALIGGAIKIVLTIIWPTVSWLWADLAQGPIVAMRTLVGWLSHLPYGDIPMPAPAWWMVVAYFGLLAVAASPLKRPGTRFIARVSFVACLFALLLLPFRTSAASSATASRGLRVTLLAIGAGQCAVVEPPSGRTTIVDAGTLTLADPVRRCIGPFLRQRGITSIDTIAISHANSDHYSAVAELAGAYGVREILTGSGFEREAKTNASTRQLLDSLATLDRPPRTVIPGEIIPLGRQTNLHVLWPPALTTQEAENADAATLDANDRSMVVRLTHGEHSILFTGDIENGAMSHLLLHPDRLKSDVLIAPHHGSSESLTTAFVNAVDPVVIVSSNDRTLTGKQIIFEKLVAGRKLLRTHTAGAVSVVLDDNGSIDVRSTLHTKPPAG